MKKNFVRISAIIIVMLVLCCCVFALAACDENDETPTENPAQFKENTRFYIDNETTDFMGQINGGEDGESGLLDKIEHIALNNEQTYFEFGKDGMLHAQVQTKDGLFADIDGLLSLIKGFNKDFDINAMLGNFDIEGGLNYYVEPMFPGFSAKIEAADLKGALGLIQHSLGFNIDGLDYEDEGVKEALQYVAQNKSLPGNLLSLIPKDTVLRLTFDTQYAIRRLTGSDGKQYTAIYLGYNVKDNPDTEPFGVFTMTEEDSVKKLWLRLEFMDINIGLKTA